VAELPPGADSDTKARDAAAPPPAAAPTELSRSVAEYRAETPATPPEQAGTADAVAAPEQAPAETAAPAKAAPEPRVAEPISYWELPQSVREELPELHITVLVFAERPEDRFVLVGGQRMGERHDVGGGLVLEEIRRDGAIFSYRKYRFLVKG
jgi:general secretion pathway protein B